MSEQAQNQQQAQVQPVQAQIPKEQKEILDTMNELLMAAQELSYTVALVPNELIEKNEELKDLVEAARNVVRATYKFYKIVKKRGRR